MRISVITVCFNAAATLTDAVQSVLSQVPSPEASFDLEYIVVDGGSTTARSMSLPLFATASPP